jgi:hypothetical protein
MTARGFEFNYKHEINKNRRKIKPGEFDDRDYDFTPEEQKKFDEKWNNMVIHDFPKMPNKS